MHRVFCFFLSVVHYKVTEISASPALLQKSLQKISKKTCFFAENMIT